MANQKSTAGPWVVKQTYSDHCFGCGIQGADGKSITAITPNQKRPAEERRANAYMIAAAPDLFNALSALADVAEARGIPVDAARAALARAQS